VEKWKTGKVEKWKSGKVEKWKNANGKKREGKRDGRRRWLAARARSHREIGRSGDRVIG
jgi:hypothetical protein